MTEFCIFGEEMFFLEIVLKTKYLCIALAMWECSSVVVEGLRTFEFKINFNISLF